MPLSRNRWCRTGRADPAGRIGAQINHRTGRASARDFGDARRFRIAGRTHCAARQIIFCKLDKRFSLNIQRLSPARCKALISGITADYPAQAGGQVPRRDAVIAIRWSVNIFATRLRGFSPFESR